MTNTTFERLMMAAALAGVPVWLGVEYGAGLGALGIAAGAAVSLGLMLAVYLVSRRQGGATVTRRARYRLRLRGEGV